MKNNVTDITSDKFHPLNKTGCMATHFDPYSQVFVVYASNKALYPVDAHYYQCFTDELADACAEPMFSASG